MRSHRTTARRFLLVLLGGLAAGAVAGPAAPTNVGPDSAMPVTRPPRPPLGPQPSLPPSTPQPGLSGSRIVFPVVGPVQYTNDFGAPRSQGAHQGNDIMAPKRSLAVAAEAGTVKFASGGAAGCYLYLYGARSRTTYLYIHLNNDLTTGNDNRGRCVAGVAYARGLRSGTTVKAGEPVGFVGDSGDADGVAPHLHFELHPRGGRAVSPYPYLNRAVRLLFAVGRGQTFTLRLAGRVVRTSGGRLELRVRTLTSWPGSFRFTNVNRSVDLAVPTTALIERRSDGIARTVSVPALTTLTRGLPVTVWTPPAACTLAAQMGRDGALSASRIVISD